jgi:cell division protein FtsZ
MQVTPEIERFARIKVVGVGGAGGNVLDSMIEAAQIQGVEFVAVNTDAQDLSVSKAVVKVPIGQRLTGGLGAGAEPSVGRAAAEESVEEIRKNLEGADMVFVAAGMGGGTGTGAAPVVAQISRDSGALTIGVVTKPFDFEGSQRKLNAEKGIEILRGEVDALITIPNQRLLDVADENMSIVEAFKLSDSVLNQGVQGISDLIVMPGLINVDFADVKTIMQNAGTALMGIGIGTGDNRAEQAARDAVASPLLGQSLEGAKGILFNITGGPDMTMREVDRAAQIIREIAHPDVNFIFGTSVDERLEGKVKITVIATGFEAYEGGRDAFGFSAPTRTKRFDPTEVIEEAKQRQGRGGLIEEVREPFIGHVTDPQGGDPQDDEHKHDDAPEENPKKPKKVFKPEDFEGDFDDKYDIPAFLRGR